MSINLNFENPKNLYKKYNTYSIIGKAISVQNNLAYDRYYGGVPLSQGANRTIYVDQTDSHTMIFGSTGSKKTRTVVMPTIKILGVAGESMIINDPKGELYHRLEGDLRQQGYNISVLNFRDPSRGNCWNPLAIPYRWYVDGNIDKAMELVNDIATNLMTSENIGNSDPYWGYSAGDLFFGLTLLLFRYCKDHNKPNDVVNISNLLLLRRKLFSNRDYDEDLWQYAQEDELTAASLSGTITAAAGTTRASILSVFDQHMRIFVIQPTLINMLSSSMDIDIGFMTENKSALFIITPDEKSSYHRLVSLFIKQSYEYIVYRAMQNSGGKVSVRLNYVLDEFGALPAITDMNSMIAAARSRDIRFVLVTQSKHQLIQHYGNDAQTIISNCNNWIFLTSREIELLQDISQLCGQDEKQKPNMSVFDLQHFDKESGEALLLCARMKPCKINLLDISEYYYPTYEYISAKEVPMRQMNEQEKLDFALSDEVQVRLGIKEDKEITDSNVVSNDIDNDFEKMMAERMRTEIRDALFELISIMKSENIKSGNLTNESITANDVGKEEN